MTYNHEDNHEDMIDSLMYALQSVPQMPKFKVKSKKWYGWFWPPERRRIKIAQLLLDRMVKNNPTEFIEKIRTSANVIAMAGAAGVEVTITEVKR